MKTLIQVLKKIILHIKAQQNKSLRFLAKIPLTKGTLDFWLLRQSIYVLNAKTI